MLTIALFVVAHFATRAYEYDWPLLPVVHRADFSRLEGVITLDDILRAYRQASKEKD